MAKEEKKEVNKTEEPTEKEQALNVVNQVCNSFKGTLEEHKLIQSALGILAK